MDNDEESSKSARADLDCFVVTIRRWRPNSLNTGENGGLPEWVSLVLDVRYGRWLAAGSSLLTSRASEDGGWQPPWTLMFVVPFLVAWVAMAGWLLYLTATRKTYRLDRESLNVTTETGVLVVVDVHTKEIRSSQYGRSRTMAMTVFRPGDCGSRPTRFARKHR